MLSQKRRQYFVYWRAFWQRRCRAAELAARQNQPQAAALLLRFAAPAAPAAKRYDFDF